MNNFVECLYCGARYRGVICSKCKHAYIDNELIKITGEVPKWIIRLTSQDVDELTHVPIPQKKQRNFKIIRLSSIENLPYEIQQYYFTALHTKE